MRILITGGTGLIGTPLVQRLVARSDEVTVLSRSPQKVYSHFCKAVECWTSLQDKTNLNEFDAVINLAGEPIAEKRWSEEQKKLLCDSRWKITQRLTELIAASDTPPILFYQDLLLVIMATKAKSLSMNQSNHMMSLLIIYVSIGKHWHKMHNRIPPVFACCVPALSFH